MSLEAQISALVQASNNLTSAVNNKIDEIDSKVDAATNEISDKFVSLSSQVYFVDGLAGNDGNDGLSALKPFKTLSKAYEKIKISSAAIIEVRILRNGTYALPFSVSGTPLASKITIRASGESNVTYPDGLGVTINISGGYVECMTSHEFVSCNISVGSNTYGFLCGDGIKVRTFQCKVIKSSSLQYFVANYSNPAGINYATFQETTFDGQGSVFYPVGKLSGTTLWKHVSVTMKGGAAMNPSYTTIADVYFY